MRVSRIRGQAQISMPIALAATFAVLFALIGAFIALHGLRISSEGRAEEGLTGGMFGADLLQRRVDEKTLTETPELVEPPSPRAADGDVYRTIRRPEIIEEAIDMQARVETQQRTGFLYSLERNMKDLRREATDLIQTKHSRLREAELQHAQEKYLAAYYEELKKQAASNPSGFAGGHGDAGGHMMGSMGSMSMGSMGAYSPPPGGTPPPPPPGGGSLPPPPPPTGGTAYQGGIVQGMQMQGTYMQGTSPQGTTMQGTAMQGTNMQGIQTGMYGGVQPGIQHGLQAGVQAGLQAGTQGPMQGISLSPEQLAQMQNMSPEERAQWEGQHVAGAPEGGGYAGVTREQYEQERQVAWQQHEQEMRAVAEQRGWQDLGNIHMTEAQRGLMGMGGHYADFRAGFIKEPEVEEVDVALLEEDEESAKIVDGIGCLKVYTEEFVDGGEVRDAVWEVAGEVDLCGDFFATFDLPGRANIAGDVALHALTLGLMLKETPEQGVEAANSKLAELGLGNYVKVDAYAGLLTSGDLYALLKEEAPQEEFEEIAIRGRAVEAPDDSLFLFSGPIEEGGQSVLLGGDVSAVPTNVGIEVLGVYNPETQTFVVYDVRVIEERAEEEHREEEFRGPPMGEGPQEKGIAFVGRLLGDLVGGVIGIISELSGVPGNEDVVAQAQDVLPMLNAILGDVTDLIGSETADNPATLARIVADIKEAASGLPGEFLHGSPGPRPGFETEPEVILGNFDVIIHRMMAEVEEAMVRILGEVPGFFSVTLSELHDAYVAAQEVCGREMTQECGSAFERIGRILDGIGNDADAAMEEYGEAGEELGKYVDENILPAYAEYMEMGPPPGR